MLLMILSLSGYVTALPIFAVATALRARLSQPTSVTMTVITKKMTKKMTMKIMRNSKRTVIMKKTVYGIVGMAALLAALAISDEHVFASLCLFAAWAVCMQKSGVVNWVEEIKKED